MCDGKLRKWGSENGDRKIIGGTFAENRVKYTVVCKDFRNNHGISDIGIERWTPV